MPRKTATIRTQAAPGVPKHRRALVRLVLLATATAVVVLGTPLCAVALARAALARRDADTALRWLDRAAWFGQHRAEIAFWRARALRRLGRMDDFRAALESAQRFGYPASQLDREQVLMQAQLGQLREVEHRFPQIMQTAGEDTAEVCEAYVSGLLMNFREADALPVIDSWSKDYPDDAYPDLIRGKMFQNAGRLEDAETCLRRAFAIQPRSHEIWLRLADLLLRRRKSEEALTFYRKLTGDTKLSHTAWLQIVKCERLNGRLDEARQALAQIRSPAGLDCGDLELQEGLLAMDQERIEIAVDKLQRARAACPRSINIRQALADALRAAGRVDEALRESEAVATADSELRRADQLHDEVAARPADAELRLEIGKILLQYGDPQRGVLWVQSALNLNPRHREANQTLADYYREQAQTAPQYAKLAREYGARADAGISGRPE